MGSYRYGYQYGNKHITPFRVVITILIITHEPPSRRFGVECCHDGIIHLCP